MVSGIYAFDANKTTKSDQIHLGGSAGNDDAASAIHALEKRTFPLLVVYGELDPPYFVIQAQEVWRHLWGKSKRPNFVALKGHSHIWEIYAIGAADTSLASEILTFVSRTAQPQP